MAVAAEDILEVTRSRIESYFKQDWNTTAALKRLLEQTIRDYDHRAIYELIQNAHDAHPSGERGGRILVHLDETEGEHGVVYVANAGRPFTPENFRAITDVAASDKPLEEGIGNKGIGFKSVLQLTNNPEVYSVAPDRSGPSLRFRFATRDDIRDVIEADGIFDDADSATKAVLADVPHLCLPVPVDSAPGRVAELLEDGFSTVVALPLKSDEARVEAAGQLDVIEDGPPPLLFLRRLIELTIRRTSEGDDEPTTLERFEQPLLISEDLVVHEVLLGSNDEYVVIERAVSSGAFKQAIDRSVTEGRLGDGWSEWDGEARVGIAVPRHTEEPVEGRMYTFLPMGEGAKSPLPAHINGPFFARLARVDLEQTVPLNAFLLDEIALTCATAALMASQGTLHLEDAVLCDLISWSGDHERLDRAFASLGHSLADAPIVPVLGERRYCPLSEVYIWSDDEREVITRQHVAPAAQCEFVHPALDGTRGNAIDMLAKDVLDHRLLPSDKAVGDWVEALAASMHRDRFDAERWSVFYDELRSVVSTPAALAGRRILLDDQPKLRQCLGSGNERLAVPFFPPRTDADGDDEADADVELPRRLRQRLFFLNSQLRWNRREGSTRRNRPGRSFLEEGLVNEYRAAELFAIVGEASEADAAGAPDAARELLEWTTRFFEQRTEPPWNDLARVRLRVPTIRGDWILASESFFGLGWRGPRQDTDQSLIDFIEEARLASTSVAALRRRIVLKPTDWPFPARDADFLLEFLERAGVRHGLWPEPIADTERTFEGRELQNGWLTSLMPDEPEHDLWAGTLVAQPSLAQRPATAYRPQHPYFRIPGQADYEALSESARRTLATLLVDGLAVWPDHVLRVDYRRYNDANDRITIPTPALAFLQQVAWVPESTPGSRARWEYREPGLIWTHHEHNEVAPNYLPLLPRPLRVIANRGQRAEERLRDLGVDYWDDPDSGALRVVALTSMFEDRLLGDAAVALALNDYQEAWADAVSSEADPFDELPSLVVQRRGAIELWDVDQPEAVYVEDEIDKSLRQMLERLGKPIFRLHHQLQSGVASYLSQQLREKARLFSDCALSVVAGHDVDVRCPLIDDDGEWLVQLIVALLETWSGFPRPTATTVARAKEILDAAEIEFTDHFVIQLDGTEIDCTSAGLEAVVDDGPPPAIVTTHVEATGSPALYERIAPQIAELCDIAYIADTLRLKLIEFDRQGFSSTEPPDLDDIADVLGESADVVRQHWIGSGSEASELLRSLLPFAAAVDLDDAGHTWTNRDKLTDRAAVLRWFEQVTDGRGTPEVVSAFQGDGRVQRLLDAIGATPRQIDDAAEQLGPPFRTISSAEGIRQQFQAWKQRNRDAFSAAVRTSHLDAFRRGDDLSSYLSLRDIDSVEPDLAWVDQFIELSDEVMSVYVDGWLAKHDCVAMGEGADLEPVHSLRLTNRSNLEAIIPEAQLLTEAWSRKQKPDGTPSLDFSEAADAATERGLLDFVPLQGAELVRVLQLVAGWPDGMCPSLELSDLGITEDDVAAVTDEVENRRREEALRRKQIQYGEGQLTVDRESLPAIVREIRERADLTRLKGTADLVELDPIRSTGTNRRGTRSTGRPGSTQGDIKRPTREQTAGIGLVGEVLALEWLKRRYPGVGDDAWKSGYRNQVLGLDEGSDDLGFDFEVHDGGKRLLFEVKATTRDDTAFKMSPGEMRCAQSLGKNEEYRILFVRRALDPDDFEIIPLDNPFARKSRDRFRFVGDGVRVELRLSADSQPRPNWESQIH